MQLKNKTLSAVALVAILVAAYASLAPASANHTAADKMAVSGSTLSVSAPGETVTLLTGTMKTSSPTDLVLAVSLECSILTQVTTVGNDESQAFGQVEVWIEIDGQPVGVIDGDDGKVVFCNRTHRQTTTLFDDEDATIQGYIETRSSHSFNWIALNLGSATHTIEVKASLSEEATNNALAKAVVGKRTLVAEPTKLANDIVL